MEHYPSALYSESEGHLEYLEYANQVVYSGLAKDTNLLERVQRQVTEMVTGLHGISYSRRLEILDLYPLEYKRLQRDLLLVYSLFSHGQINTIHIRSSRKSQKARQKTPKSKATII